MKFLFGLLLFAGFSTAGAARSPTAGVEVPELAPFDRQMVAIMAKWKVPGAALAVVHGGRLVLARGYGYADRAARKAVEPESLFRIASVSKPITAITLMKLVEDGLLGLDEQMLFHLLWLPGLEAGEADPRLARISIRHLLQHSGGWDSNISGDPMFDPRALRKGGSPASCDNVIRHSLGQRLDFDPGSRFAYSNFAYCVLGRVITGVTGMTYEHSVRESLLAPLGIRRMAIGIDGSPLDGEVSYYPAVGEDPDGFSINALDAHGGWVASVVELARLMAAVDGLAEPADVLSVEMLSAMVEPPSFQSTVAGGAWYGMGFSVRDVPGSGFNWWHAGSLPGTHALAVRAWDGTLWVVLMNHRPQNWTVLGEELDQALWKAKAEVTSWPQHDLFQRYLD